jgi:hypothetical protein
MSKSKPTATAIPATALPVAPATALPIPVPATVTNKAVGLLSSQQVNVHKNALPQTPATALLFIGSPSNWPKNYTGLTSHRANMVNAFLAYVGQHPGLTLAQLMSAMLQLYPRGWGSVPCSAAQVTGFLQPNGYINYKWPSV